MLRDVFARKDRVPVLIATEAILQDAIANEKTLMDKLADISEGERVSLKELVSKVDWDTIMKDVKRSFKVKVKIINKKVKEVDEEDGEDDVGKIDGVNLKNLMQYFRSQNLLVGKMIRYLYKKEDKITFEEFKCGMAYDKSDQQFRDNIFNGQSYKSKYGKLWNMEGGIIQINPKIKSYIDSVWV